MPKALRTRLSPYPSISQLSKAESEMTHCLPLKTWCPLPFPPRRCSSPRIKTGLPFISWNAKYLSTSPFPANHTTHHSPRWSCGRGTPIDFRLRYLAWKTGLSAYLLKGITLPVSWVWEVKLGQGGWGSLCPPLGKGSHLQCLKNDILSQRYHRLYFSPSPTRTEKGNTSYIIWTPTNSCLLLSPSRQQLSLLVFPSPRCSMMSAT